MRIFQINNNTQVVCQWVKTRSAFKHTAALLVNGREVANTKVCYQNRAWESYEYETVLRKLLQQEKLLPEKELNELMQNLSGKAHEEVNGMFKTTAMMAAIGDIIGNSTKEKNDWKSRMLKAGIPGLNIPDEWDNLSEDVKEKRLNAVIQFAKQK